MSDFPENFNLDKLTQKDDVVLRDRVVSKFSEDSADYVAEKYIFDAAGKNFNEYVKEVEKIIKECKTDEQFVDKIQDLNEIQELPLF